MAKGLKIPVGSDSTGGTAMVEKDKSNFQVIMTALSDCDSTHAFQQDLGLGSGMVFDVDDFTLRAQIRRRVEAIFKDFEREDRFKLLPETIEWSSGDGELTMEFKYLDLESDEVFEFTKVFTPGD
jgi:hypothetical protein